MLRTLLLHLRGNAVGYLALFAVLGGTSYAAVSLAPRSVTSRALAPGAVTHGKLAADSVDSRTIVDGTITAKDFRKGTLKAVAESSATGPAGPAGAQGPSGANGNASIALRARGTGAVTAPHGGNTSVPLGSASWTQAANELDLVAGSASVTIPSACTGSFGNSLVVSVDGKPATFAPLPAAPASTTLTVPIVVSPVTEPTASASHQLAATVANSCTKDGEDFKVGDVKVDVLAFH